VPLGTGDDLEDGIPLFLDQLIDGLRVQKASSAGLAETAAQCGRALLERGFTVAQVVHEYGGVCQAVTGLADEMKVPITAAEFQLLNQCVDEAIAQAVTEFTHAREQAMTREGEDRLADLAHELRNSLGAAMLSFQVIKRGSVATGGATASLLERSLTRALALVESSIAEVRVHSGAQALDRVSVRELIGEVAVGATIEASSRGIALAVMPPDAGVDVKVDRQVLAAAVANLLQNAFKFTRPCSTVLLSTSFTAHRVSIEVEDECGGLPPGDPAELFRRFEQRGRDRTGLGLGLSICRKSVEAAGGEIHLRDMPGTGCVFTIDLPRLSPDP
jgi:signal transduction histidine kinase